MENDDRHAFSRSQEFSYRNGADVSRESELLSTVDSTGERATLLERFDSDAQSKAARLDRAGLVGCVVSFAAVILAAAVALTVALWLQNSDNAYDGPWTGAVYDRVFESYDALYKPFLNDRITLYYGLDDSKAGGGGVQFQATLYMLPGDRQPAMTTTFFTFQMESTQVSIVSAATLYYWLHGGSFVNISICSYNDVPVDFFLLKGQQSYAKWWNSKRLDYLPDQSGLLQSQCSSSQRSPHTVQIKSREHDLYFFLFLLPKNSSKSMPIATVSATFDLASRVYDTSTAVSNCTADLNHNCTLPVYNYHPVYQIQQQQQQQQQPYPPQFVYNKDYPLNVFTRPEVSGGFIALMCVMGVAVLAMAVTVAICTACFCHRRRKRKVALRAHTTYTVVQ